MTASPVKPASVDDVGRSIAARSVAPDLTLRTIEEQQCIIAGLREIARSLKGELSVLEERLLTCGSSAVDERVAALERENASLRSRVTSLSRGKSAVEVQLRLRCEEVGSLKSASAEMEGRLADCAAREERASREQAVEQLARVRYTALDSEVRQLQGKNQTLEMQGRRWRALVDVVLARVGPALGSHIHALVESITAAEGGPVGVEHLCVLPSSIRIHDTVAANASDRHLGAGICRGGGVSVSSSQGRARTRPPSKKSRFLTPL